MRHHCLGLGTTLLVIGLAAAGTGPACGQWQKSGNKAEFVGGHKAIEAYGRSVLHNDTLTCASANGKAGYLTILNLATGVGRTVAGIGARGPITITGGDGASRSGTGGLLLSSKALWDAIAQKLTLRGNLLGQFAIDVGDATVMPTDQMSAEALFDQVFGPAARAGYPLDRVRIAAKTGTPMAFYTYLGQQVPNGSGGNAVAYAAGGIMLTTYGRVVAVHLSGVGAWASYVK